MARAVSDQQMITTNPIALLTDQDLTVGDTLLRRGHDLNRHRNAFFATK